MSMTVEELKEKLATGIEIQDCGGCEWEHKDAPHCNADADLCQPCEWQLKMGGIAIQAFIQFCEEQNIYQVTEGELPEITNDEVSAAIAIFKWHKQSLKLVSEVLK